MLKRSQIETFYEDVGRLGLKFPISAIARATGFSKGNVSEYVNRKKEPSESFLNKFYEVFPKQSINVPREVGSEKNQEMKDSGDYSSYTTKAPAGEQNVLTAIMSLAASGNTLAKANLELAQSNKTMAKNNEELILLLKSVDDPKEIPVNVEARFSDLLVLIAELGTGTRWKSKQQALAELSKLWHGKKQGELKESIRDGSGKSHR